MPDSQEDDGDALAWLEENVADFRTRPEPVPNLEAVETDNPLETFFPPPPVVLAPVLPSLAAFIEPCSLGNVVGEAVRAVLQMVPTLSFENAWVLLWRLLLQIEPRTGLPAIIDGNDMQQGKPYYERARRVQAFFAQVLAVSIEELPNRISLLVRAGVDDGDEAERLQNNRNTTGTGFEVVLRCLLETLSGIPSNRILANRFLNTVPCFRPSETLDRKPDLLVVDRDGNVTLMLTVKWSLRGDRKDGLVEDARSCRQRITTPNLRCGVVTNDFNPGRLRKLLVAHPDRDPEHPIFDVIYHVAPHLLAVAHDMPRVLGDFVDEGRLRSVADLFRESRVL